MTRNGNLTNDGTRSFAYSPENQLTNITVAGAWKSDFVFDGLGRRRVELDYGWQGGQWTKTNELHFVYDGWLLVQVRDGSNNVLWTLTRGLDLSGTLAGAGGIGGVLARTDSNGSTLYHADGAGNITALMDGQQNIAARYMYSPFGKTVAQWGVMAPVNRIMFSSKEHLPNADDIYDYGGRFWFTNPGRWGSRDPAGETGDINLYRGMFNSPLNVVDPFGLDPAFSPGISMFSGLSAAQQVLASRTGAPATAAIVASAATGGAADALLVGGGLMTAGSLSTAVTVGALSGLGGDAAYQGTRMALGDQQRFSGTELAVSGAVGGVLGGAANKLAPLLRTKCPPKARIAPGAGYPSKSAGGTLFTGGYDPADNAVYLGDAGHPQGVAAAGGNPNAPGIAGITVVDMPSGVIWANDSPSLNAVLTPDQAAAVQSALESAFPGKTVTQVPAIK